MRWLTRIGQMFKGIVTVVKFILWLRREKKELETHTAEYLSADNARRTRLNLEKIFHALEQGKLDGLPPIVQWLFARTTVDNQIGLFGLHVLKSNKLRDGAEVLNTPVEWYRCH